MASYTQERQPQTTITIKQCRYTDIIMGRKAKLKKIRQQNKTNVQSRSQYNQTEFVEQFEKMGYQLKIDPHRQPTTNRGNVSPEIPQERIEPQL